MAKCRVIGTNNTKVCIGNMRHIIDIQVRLLTPPAQSSVDYSLSFMDVRTVSAYIETFPGVAQFDRVNIERIATHDFYIRYMFGVKITQENWIKYNGELYDILLDENIGERNEWLRLRATKRGSEDAQGNFS